MSYNNRNKKHKGNNSQSDSKKGLVCYFHKRDPDARMKEYKIKIDEDEYEKLLFPCIYDTTPKEEILELVTLFYRHIKDCEMFIPKPDNESEAQKSERLKAEKKVYRLFKWCLFDNVVDKWDSTVESYTGRRHNMTKFNEIVHLFLNKTLPHDSVEQIRTYLTETKKPRVLDSKTWIQRVIQINKLIPIIDDDENSYSSSEIIKKIIIPNVPLD